MKRTIFQFTLIMLVVLFIGSSVLGVGAPMSLESASKKFSGKKTYIIGSFKMVHTKLTLDPSLQLEDNNMWSRCILFVSMESKDDKSEYTFEFKPVTGSNYPSYRNKGLFAKNDNDPYWVVDVPLGNYTLTTLTFRLVNAEPGYETYSEVIFAIPLSREIKRDVTFDAKAKQIVYIGDYQANFKTNICMENKTTLRIFRQYKVTLTDNFAATKELLKTYTSDLEFVSGL